MDGSVAFNILSQFENIGEAEARINCQCPSAQSVAHETPSPSYLFY